ncbi:MAG: hypothetical protein MUF13_02150 [Akkermansiaceae bacterium]|nr:hypothetical protein [Akkermansiaceae bacterium]
MKHLGWWACLGLVPLWAGEMPEKAAEYHAALVKRPESATLFDRFREAWLEEKSAEELEAELAERAAAGDPGAWAILGRVRRMAGREEAALEAFSKAREQEPAAWLDLETAKLRLAAKDFAGAEKDALAVPEESKDRAEALKLAGLACLRADKLDEALAHWAKAVAAAPGEKGLLEDLTEMTRREGRFDLALDFCKKWRDATDDAYAKAMATLRMADLLLASQRLDQALTELAAVLRSSGDGSWLETETLARAEQAHRQRGDARAWAQWIGGQAGEHPTRLNFRRVHARALADSGKSDEALEVLAEVLKRSPGDLAARWQRVDLLARAMKLEAAFQECKVLAAEEKSETAALRWADLAFQLEKKDEVKLALDAVMAAADPARRVSLAGHYARYGLPAESERIWRDLAKGEEGGQALRELGKHLRAAAREKDAVEVWKQLGAREVAGDRIEAAQMLAALGDTAAARELLVSGQEKFSGHPGYEAALAEIAWIQKKPEEAREIFLKLARSAGRVEELSAAIKGWLRSVVDVPEPDLPLGETTADRCLRAAWLLSKDKPLPAIVPGDELERTHRLNLLRENGKWPDLVALMETTETKRGPLFFSELAEAKSAAGDTQGALDAARAWRERAPDQPGPWLREAQALETAGESAQAILLLRRASARFEENEEIARSLFSLLSQATDPREASSWAWKRHDRSEDEAVRSGWLREILKISKKGNQLAELQDLLEERARRDPASPGPLKALAELAKTRGDSRAELNFLRRAANNAPRDVALIAALATIEERSGETTRALERYQSLVRLAPGPDAARQLAQAKIRLGDIEGGVRDLQALAGDKGLDLRALEASAGDLASRGFVEEAIRLLSAIDPPKRDARLHFLLGFLLELDGREHEALDAYAKVLSEPDDPAEIQNRGSGQFDEIEGRVQVSISNLLSRLVQEFNRNQPIGMQNSQFPRSLVDAKRTVRQRLASMAVAQGGELWTRVHPLIPEFAGSTRKDWQELMEAAADNDNYSTNWLEFLDAHPDNPLGLELFAEQGQFTRAPADRIKALLKREPRLPAATEMKIRLGRTGDAMSNVRFLESLTAADWENPAIRPQALGMIDRTVNQLGRAAPKPTLDHPAPPPFDPQAAYRAFALLEKIAKPGEEARSLELLAARIALVEKRPDDFIRHINAWTPADGIPDLYGSGFRHSYYYLPHDVFGAWTEKHGEKAADALVARIESPIVRCQLTVGRDPEIRLKRIDEELAALPPDAPKDIRRSLLRFKMNVFAHALVGEQRKFLDELAANTADPALALEARFHLMRGENRRYDDEFRAQLVPLVRQLMASPDETDRLIAQRYSYLLRQSHSPNSIHTPPVTRWGAPASFHSGSGGGSYQQVKTILAMDDRASAARAAARILEHSARGGPYSGDSIPNLSQQFEKAGLLQDAVALIEQQNVPETAGLARKQAMVRLFEGCGKPEIARKWLASLSSQRPEETRWTVQLALASPDDADFSRLLNSVAGRPDFDSTLATLLGSTRNSKPEEALKPYLRLADWAAKSPRRHRWMAGPIVALATGRNLTQKPVSKDTPAQLECFRRFIQIAENDPTLSEVAFRARYASRIDSPEDLAQAGRLALLSGAYNSTDRSPASGRSGNRIDLPEAPASLEHLVIQARKIGDEAAFPEDFREKLRAVDPITADWIQAMLLAKDVANIPDVSAFSTANGPWPALARHEAALLRAVALPGRDAWLKRIFRESSDCQFSYNLRHVICQSLFDAREKKAFSKHVIALLEAATGPRKSWAIPKERKPDFIEARQKRALIAAHILESAGQIDSAALLDVLRALREQNVMLADGSGVSEDFTRLWRSEMQPPASAKLADLIGTKSADPFLIGFWQQEGTWDQAPSYIWALPRILQNGNFTARDELLKNLINDPDPSLIDLLHVWSANPQKENLIRLLHKAAPVLAKLPDPVRAGVILSFAPGIGMEDLKDLPAIVANPFRARLEEQRKREIQQARVKLKQYKPGALPPTSPLEIPMGLGSIASTVLGADDAMLDEILGLLEPLLKNDKSGANQSAFLNSFFSRSNQSAKWSLDAMRLLERIWKQSPPPPFTPGSQDPITRWFNTLPPGFFQDPANWHDISMFTPPTQALIWSQVWISAKPGREAALDRKIRDAVKASPVTLAAFEWHLESEASRLDRNHVIDQGKWIAYLTVLKDAGISPDRLAFNLSKQSSLLGKLKDPSAFMVFIPELLEGTRTLPPGFESNWLNAIHQIWRKAESSRRGSGELNKEITKEKTPQYFRHEEAIVFLNFILDHQNRAQGEGYVYRELLPMVLSSQDDALVRRWVKEVGQSLTGDRALILYLLERKLVAEALAIAPSPGEPTMSHSSDTYYFDSKIESAVAKLKADPSPRAFCLAADLSRLPDLRKGSGTPEAMPREAWADRRKRLLSEYASRAAEFSFHERAAICVSLGLDQSGYHEAQPLLNEFAGDTSVSDFRKSLTDGPPTPLARLFVPAACSLAHGGDLSGMERLAAVLSNADLMENRGNTERLLRQITPCLVAHANRLDAKLPPATIALYLQFAKAHTALKGHRLATSASYLVHVASMDLESLANALKELGLEKVPPVFQGDVYFQGSRDISIETATLRIALMHPVSSPALINAAALGSHGGPSPLVPLLSDPALRAKIPVDLFLRLTTRAYPIRREDLDLLQTYITERKADFTPEQMRRIEAQHFPIPRKLPAGEIPFPD